MNHIHDVIELAKTEGRFPEWPEVWQKHVDRWACDHGPNLQARYKVSSNGVKSLGHQCLTCGEWIRRKKEYFGFDIPTTEFCQSIKDEYREKRNEEAKVVYEIWSEVRSQKRSEEKARWLGNYDAYLESEQWQQKRRKALARDGYLCQGCMERPATEVHHLTYKNVFNEFLFELVSVCSKCHVSFHGQEIEGVDITGLTK